MECCRVCLGTQDLTNIFSIKDTAENILLFADVQVQKNDGFPQYICLLCKHELDICVIFKEKVETSYEVLTAGQDCHIIIQENILLNEPNLKREIFDEYDVDINVSEVLTRNKLPNVNKENTGNIKNELVDQIDNEKETRKEMLSNNKFAFVNDNKSTHNNFKENMEPEVLLDQNHMEVVRDEDNMKKNSNFIFDPDNMEVVSENTDDSNSIDNYFSSEEELNQEEENEETLVNQETIFFKTYTCFECTLYFNSAQSLDLHMDTIHKNTKEICQICLLMLPNAHILKTHLEKEHNVTEESEHPFKCRVCKEHFEHQAQLNKHICSQSNVKYFKCTQCDYYITRSRENFEKHINHVHAELQFECGDCGEIFPTHDKYRNHLKSHKTHQELCTLCGKFLRDKRALTSHQKLHRNERDFSCMECDKSYINKNDLRRHVLKTHEKQRLFDRGQYDRKAEIESKRNSVRQCEECGQICGNTSDLNKHLRSHSDVRPYVCPMCEKSFKNSSAMHAHVRTHTGQKPFKCEECGKEFAQSSNLRSHQQVHSGERPHICTICNKAFIRKRGLETHLLKHDNLITYTKDHTYVIEVPNNNRKEKS